MRQQGFVPILVIVIILALTGGTFIAAKTIKFPSFSKVSEIDQSSDKDTPQPSSKSALELLKTRPGQNKTPSPSATSSNKTPSPIPVKTGSIKGRVVGGYYSASLSQANVVAKNQGVEKNATTDNSGNFTVSSLPVGKYTLSFTHADYNFNDWKDYEVKEGENILPRTPNGFLKVFKPTTIKGTVFIDRNGNNQKDSDEGGLNAILILQNKIGDSDWGNHRSISADSSGNFSFDIPDGSTYKIVPGEYTFYNKPATTAEFVVDGYGGTKEFSFPYYPTASQAGLDIIVFNDKNENGNPDPDEENIDYYYAEITNTTTGATEKTSVSATPGGNKGEKIYDYGVYNIKLVAGDASWAYYYKITRGETTVSITNNSGKQTAKLGAHKLQ